MRCVPRGAQFFYIPPTAWYFNEEVIIEDISSIGLATGTCRIGTRGSRLALWQAHAIEGRLQALGIQTKIEIIKTQGDRIDNVPFSQLEGKGFFTKELEEAQLAGRIDLAVHSLKDLATSMPAGLTLAAMVGREDPREVLLALNEAVDADRGQAGLTLPLIEGATIGTSAVRRQAQVHSLRPDLRIVDLRGNVPTRIEKLRERRYDAILLARAGLVRLDLPLDGLFAKIVEVDRFVPAPAQGMMGIQCREEGPWRPILAKLHSADDAPAVEAERQMLQQLEGGCQLPFGIHLRRDESSWRLDAFLASSSEDDAPCRVSLVGPTRDALVEQAWQQLCSKWKT